MRSVIYRNRVLFAGYRWYRNVVPLPFVRGREVVLVLCCCCCCAMNHILWWDASYKNAPIARSRELVNSLLQLTPSPNTCTWGSLTSTCLLPTTSSLHGSPAEEKWLKVSCVHRFSGVTPYIMQTMSTPFPVEISNAASGSRLKSVRWWPRFSSLCFVHPLDMQWW